MSTKPLIAAECPPDFPHITRTGRYDVIDAARNRSVGSITKGFNHAYGRDEWTWIISIPREGARQEPSPSGHCATLKDALAALRQAWDAHPAKADDPPRSSWVWSDAARGLPLPGQGAWRPGEEPRGWQRA